MKAEEAINVFERAKETGFCVSLRGWKDIECEQPKDDTLVLCKVQGLPFTEFIVSNHTEEGWWIYVPSLGEQFKGGWLGLPHDAKVTHWQYIQF